MVKGTISAEGQQIIKLTGSVGYHTRHHGDLGVLAEDSDSIYHSLNWVVSIYVCCLGDRKLTITCFG
jgi:hypothetical protein